MPGQAARADRALAVETQVRSVTIVTARARSLAFVPRSSFALVLRLITAPTLDQERHTAEDDQGHDSDCHGRPRQLDREVAVGPHWGRVLLLPLQRG